MSMSARAAGLSLGAACSHTSGHLRLWRARMNRAAVVAAAVCLLRCLNFPGVARAEPGMLAEFSDGKTTVHTPTLTPAFVLKENESVHPQVGAKFTAKYEGMLRIVRRATYMFTADGAKLSLGGKPVAGPVELDPGEHAIEITFE